MLTTSKSALICGRPMASRPRQAPSKNHHVWSEIRRVAVGSRRARSLRAFGWTMLAVPDGMSTRVDLVHECDQTIFRTADRRRAMDIIGAQHLGDGICGEGPRKLPCVMHEVRRRAFRVHPDEPCLAGRSARDVKADQGAFRLRDVALAGRAHQIVPVSLS